MRLAVFGFILPALVLVSTQLYSSTETNEVRACVGRVDGRVRIVSDLTRCGGIEQPLVWNKQGVPGEVGEQGPIGPPGVQGLPGLPGTRGAVGATGPGGAVGLQGPQGEPGTTGPVGPAGPAGPRGPVGPSGVPGIPGVPGAQGVAGTPGMRGEVGPVGPRGDSIVQSGTGGKKRFAYAGPSSTPVVSSIGPIGMNQVCAYTYENSRMCDTRELIETPGKIDTPTESMWIRPHVVGNQGGLVIDFSGMAQAVDNMTCAGPSTMGGETGTMPWISNNKTSTGLVFNITHIDYGACNIERPVACCRVGQ